jgi:hypothetical protein
MASKARQNVIKLNSWVDAASFGAVGDGVTNASIALQAAIDATPESGTLFIPPGTYMVEKLSLTRPITIQGASATLKLLPTTAVFPALAPPIVEVLTNNAAFFDLAFDGNKFNQTGGHSDWVVYHRRSCAITGYDVKYQNLTIERCTFNNFYNGAVIIMADNTRIIDCNFTNINTEAYLCSANQSASLPNYPAFPDIITDGVFIDNCVFENIGTKDTVGDTRQYGNDLPVVTGDVLLFRAKNTIVSNCQFYNFDREALKFERPDGNHVITGCIFRNDFDGNSVYTVFQFNSASAAKTPSATDPSNIVITNNIMLRPSGFGGIGGGAVKSHYGIVIANNIVTCNSGGTNGSLLLSGIEQCVIANNIFMVNNATNPGFKFTTAFGNCKKVVIANNRISSLGIGMQFAGASSGTYEDFDIVNNTFSSLSAQSTDAAPLVFTNFHVMGNKATSINFSSTGSARPNLTNIVLTNNILDSPPVGSVASGYAADNLVKTISVSSRNIVDGYFDKAVTSTHFRAGPSGQQCAFDDGDTTPSVKGKTLFSAENTSATVITNFDDPSTGQEITIHFTNGNTTIAESSNVRLAGTGDFVGTANDILTLVYIDFVGWVEKARAVN